MDSFEQTIEHYKRELMKYAERNGAVYAGGGNGFTQVEEQAEAAEKVSSKNEFASGRPLPVEYDGGEDVKFVSAVAASEAFNESANVPETTAANQHLRSAPSDATENEKIQEQKKYKNFEEFEADNPKTGKLRVQTYAARKAFPVSNARITVEKEFEDGIHVFSETFTDIDGISDDIVLPTKDKSLSLEPGAVIPYATYTVRVEQPQFTPLVFRDVPVFDSIESLQPAAMLPAGGNERAPLTYVEQEPLL